MQIYHYHFPADPEIISQVEEGTIFLDIETTGLKKETSLIELIGCGYYDKTDMATPLHIIQWFNDDAISEEAILQAFLHFLSEHQGPLFTFNGEGFDLPFLTAHMEYNEQSLPWTLALESHESVDLFKMLRGFVLLLGLKNGKQKSWERIIGLDREDKYDGGKLIPVYKEYLKKKEQDALDKILLHNMEDIKGLASLAICLAYHKLRLGNYTVIGVEDSGEESISFHLQLDTACPVLLPSFEQTYGRFEMISPDFCLLTIPYKAQKMYHFFSNYQDYYYLPMEDRAIHKSIGAYVDKEHRKKATAQNCYIGLDSLFFPIPGKDAGYGFQVDEISEDKAAIYKESYTHNTVYLSFEELFPESGIGAITKQYIKNVIHAIFLESIRS